jgi:hypothetical protein
MEMFGWRIRGRAGAARPEYSYTTPHNLPPIGKAIMSIICLYLLHKISHYSPSDSEALAKFLRTAQLPPSFPQLHGSKIVARPGNLSPGEYDMLLQVLPVHFISGQDGGKEVMDKWYSLTAVWKGLRG